MYPFTMLPSRFNFNPNKIFPDEFLVMPKRHLIALIAASLLAGAACAAEDECGDFNTHTISGNWGGNRADLCNKGINFGFTHKSDVLSNMDGGTQRGTAWMGHTEARVNMDLDKLLGWEATTAYIHFHSDLGNKFNRDYVGSFVGVDNIETSVNTAQFFHAWVQKGFADDSLTVLGGLYPVDSEFFVTETSGIFIQPPYGMANDMAQGGRNGPPIFPVGALAVRVKYTTPGKNFYLQGALTDGVPGDPQNPYGTHIKLDSGDGTLAVMEFGYIPQESPQHPALAQEGKREEGEYFNKTAVGFWHYSYQMDDLSEVDALGNPLQRSSQGVYFLAERTLMIEQNNASQGLSGFLRLGTASADVHQADWTGSLGLRYHGLLDGRDDDLAGIAVTYNHTSEKYKLLNNATDGQTNVELTYRAQVNNWFWLQPTLQFIRSPNMDPALNDATIIGCRAEVNF